MTWLSDKIEKSTVLIVSNESNEKCDEAKSYFLKSGFKEEEICFEIVGEDIVKEAENISKFATCPIIWVTGKVLGGCEEARLSWHDGTLPKAKYELILQEAAKDMVTYSATTNTLVVLSKKTCPPCTEVKIMLEEAGFTKEQTNVITISDWPTMDSIQEYCRQLTGERWTPRVWINGKAMGGIKEIRPMYEDETLHDLAESLAGKSGPVSVKQD